MKKEYWALMVGVLSNTNACLRKDTKAPNV
jgi:hypothetical protein